ncbi:hypothetical protein L9F63_007915, partial [Diploptera punctata]
DLIESSSIKLEKEHGVNCRITNHKLNSENKLLIEDKSLAFKDTTNFQSPHSDNQSNPTHSVIPKLSWPNKIQLNNLKNGNLRFD